jgi:hypothetical protein
MSVPNDSALLCIVFVAYGCCQQKPLGYRDAILLCHLLSYSPYITCFLLSISLSLSPYQTDFVIYPKRTYLYCLDSFFCDLTSYACLDPLVSKISFKPAPSWNNSMRLKTSYGLVTDMLHYQTTFLPVS